MNWITLTLGICIFSHYGCAIIKHDSKRSSLTIKLTLMLAVVSAVLMIVASAKALKLGINSEADMVQALVVFACAKLVLSLYQWAFGITYVRSAQEVYYKGGLCLKQLPHMIRENL
jgi:uncharacterized membrane protein (DUF485 family)